MKKQFFGLVLMALCLTNGSVEAQSKSANGSLLAPTPPMGWMTWNYFADNFNEKDIREMADAMVSNGMVKEGYAPRNRQLELERMVAESNAAIADLTGNSLRVSRQVAELTQRSMGRTSLGRGRSRASTS